MTHSEHRISHLLEVLTLSPNTVVFDDAIATINANYAFTPTRFINGNTTNESGSNNGSCKIFAFAKLHNLTPEKTLALFGDYYRIDVLHNPESNDHANIRNFMQYGWEGVVFEGNALKDNGFVNKE